MAIPDTLIKWRRFVGTRPEEPARLSATDYAALGEPQQETYNQERITWLSSPYVLAVDDTVRIQRLAALTALEACSGSMVGATGLVVSGSPTLGKTTALLHAGREHERRQRRQMALGDDPCYAPVLYVVTPPGATPKGLMSAFASALTITTHSRASAQELTELVVGRLTQLHTSMILLDEIHNLVSSSISGAEAATTLKLFAERLNAAFIYAGVDLTYSQLFAGHIGAQLKGRMAMYQMRGFAYNTNAQRSEWDSLVDSLQDYIPLFHQQDRDLVNLAPYLFARTAGSIGSLRTLLRRGAILAMLDESERITQDILDAIPTDLLSQDSYDGHIQTPTAS